MNVEHSADYLLEISSKNVNKAVGIEIALKKLDISRKKSIAFGDGENDISMLDYVEFGVAMKNANSKVKNHADFITNSNNEEGIYEFLKTIKFNLD